MTAPDNIDSSAMPSPENQINKKDVREYPESSPRGKFKALRERAHAGADSIRSQFGRLRSKTPDEILKPEADELAMLTDKLDETDKAAAIFLGEDTASEQVKEGFKLDSSEQKPLKPGDMALVRAIQDTIQAIDAEDDWGNQRTGESSYSVSPYGIMGIGVESPLRLAYGIDMKQVVDGGTWTSREASFASSLKISEAMAEFMGNDAHVAKPIKLDEETERDSSLANILKLKPWLTTLKEGGWPVAMIEKKTLDESDNVVIEEVPFSHDAQETHRGTTMFMPKSSQHLISRVAGLELKRREAGRPLTTFDDDKNPPMAGTIKDHMGELGMNGAEILDQVTDDASWLREFDKLVNAPRGTLDQRIQDIREHLDIDNASMKALSYSFILNGHLNMMNYVSRETQQLNLTEEEVRTAADAYLTELHAHVLKIRGTN